MGDSLAQDGGEGWRMPWSEMAKMWQRMRFVLDAEGELFTVTALRECYGISRLAGHESLSILPSGKTDPASGPPLPPTPSSLRQAWLVSS